jgi:uncharacterized protein (TIGR03663 family)
MSPAIFGTALVAVPYFFRSHLGRIGALAAALFLVFSPTLLYFNRFTRGDTYMEFWTLGLVICIWRYMADRRTLWLFLAAGLLALSFATKEVTFLTSALLLVFLDLLFAWELRDQLQQRSSSPPAASTGVAEEESRRQRKKGAVAPSRAQRSSVNPLQWPLVYVGLVLTAWLLAITWPLTARWRRRWGLESMAASGDMLVLLGTLAAVQFAAAVQMLPFIGDKGYYREVDENTLMKVSVFSFLIVSTYIGVLWRPRTWLIAAAIFYTIFVLLYTTFFTNMGGFWSGIWGSFDYWLQQQGVARGSQPRYYYLMILPMYEFLPLLFAAIGAAWFILRKQFLLSLGALVAVCALIFVYFTVSASLAGMIPVLVVIGIVLIALQQDLFTSFLIFWAVGALIAFAVAGEKMPWLTLHMLVPIIILAAKFLDSLFEHFSFRLPVDWRSPGALVLLAAPLGALSMLILWVTDFSAVGAILALIVGVAALGLVARAGMLYGRLSAAQAATALVIPALLVLTFRDGIRSSFQIGDWPREMLSYADTSPDIPWTRDQLASLGQQTGLGFNYPIVVDNDLAWPFVWYLRDYTKVQWSSSTMAPPVAGSIVVVSMDHKAWMDPYLDDYNEPVSIRHYWWFGDGPQYYEGVTPTDFAKSLFDPSVWNVWRNYFVDRSTPWSPPPDDALVYMPKQPATAGAPPIKPAAAIPTVTVAPSSLTVIGAPGSDRGQLSQPAGISLDAAGNLYVADSRNNRIEEFDPSGNVVRILGSGGDKPADFNEPWGVAVDKSGNVYVADTWNHRIQKFDANLDLVWTFGKPFTDLGARQPGLDEFFGPRGIAIGPDGNLLVSDTGDKRIVKISPDGQPLGSFGEGGTGQGQFNEPVGIAVGTNGDIYVADTWNGRVQGFDANFKYLGEFTVKGWSSTDVNAKPYLAVSPDGRVIISNPANARIELYDQLGKPVVGWQVPAQTDVPAGRPVGVIVDGLGSVIVSDCVGNRIYRMPLASLVAP